MLRGGLAAALVLVACTTAAATEAPQRPNIVLVTLDTTRADRLGLYGYGRNTSPHLDRLARDSLVYDRAYSTSSWTLPAHASLFTGKFPTSHGARLDPKGPLVLAEGIVGPFSSEDLRARGLSTGEQTLAGILAGLGYETAAFVGGPWMKQLFSLGRGFAHYDDDDVTDVKGRLAAQLSDAALAWIEAHASQRFFLFLNYYDPHFPYEDPEGLIREFLPAGSRVWPPQPTQEYVDAAYDAEVLYMDKHFGRLLDRMRALGLYDDAWIIVTADHGELLGEHGEKGHGRTLYQEEIRILFREAIEREGPG
jgi:arylsulfatase A-like enzyme